MVAALYCQLGSVDGSTIQGAGSVMMLGTDVWSRISAERGAGDPHEMECKTNTMTAAGGCRGCRAGKGRQATICRPVAPKSRVDCKIVIRV